MKTEAVLNLYEYYDGEQYPTLASDVIEVDTQYSGGYILKLFLDDPGTAQLPKNLMINGSTKKHGDYAAYKMFVANKDTGRRIGEIVVEDPFE